MCQRAEFVRLVLEEVGVDGSKGKAQAMGMIAQGSPVVDAVPGDVQGDGGGDTCKLVHKGGVGELLLDRARDAGLREDLEARAAVGVAPTGRFDMLRPQAPFHLVERAPLCPQYFVDPGQPDVPCQLTSHHASFDCDWRPATYGRAPPTLDAEKGRPLRRVRRVARPLVDTVALTRRCEERHIRLPRIHATVLHADGGGAVHPQGIGNVARNRVTVGRAQPVEARMDRPSRPRPSG